KRPEAGQAQNGSGRSRPVACIRTLPGRSAAGGEVGTGSTEVPPRPTNLPANASLPRGARFLSCTGHCHNRPAWVRLSPAPAIALALMSSTHELAGRPAPAELRINLEQLERDYYQRRPNLDDPAQLVAFGTSGHRGTPLDGTFTEAHILAIIQAICEH